MKDISFDVPDADERGVSPVIGVILMVAITVILAAVIASFVLGFGGNLSQPVNAGTDVSIEKGQGGSVTVTWISQGNADELNVTVRGDELEAENSTSTLDEVGDTETFSENDLFGDENEDDHSVRVIVTAIRGDAKTVVANKEGEI